MAFASLLAFSATASAQQVGMAKAPIWIDAAHRIDTTPPPAGWKLPAAPTKCVATKGAPFSIFRLPCYAQLQCRIGVAGYNQHNYDSCVYSMGQAVTWAKPQSPFTADEMLRLNVFQTLAYWSWVYPQAAAGVTGTPNGAIVTKVTRAAWSWSAALSTPCTGISIYDNIDHGISPVLCDFYKQIEAACASTLADPLAFTSCFIKFQQNPNNKQNCSLTTDPNQAGACAAWNARTVATACTGPFARNYYWVSSPTQCVKVLPKTPATLNQVSGSQLFAN